MSPRTVRSGTVPRKWRKNRSCSVFYNNYNNKGRNSAFPIDRALSVWYTYGTSRRRLFFCAFSCRSSRNAGFGSSVRQREVQIYGGGTDFRVRLAEIQIGGAVNMRVKITLACSECKQRNYDTKKNKKNDPDRLELNKYCRFCRKHTLHRETK